MKDESKGIGAFLTSSKKATCQWILNGGVATLPFETKGIHAFFSSKSIENMEKMAEFKDRDWKSPGAPKPFVTTFPIENAESEFVRSTGISPKVPKKIVESIAEALDKVSIATSRPLGLLLPANIEVLPSRLTGSVTLRNEKIPTVGFMVSGGGDPDYRDIIQSTGLGSLAGTSANLSRDNRANGSGHSHIGGLVAQLSRLNKLCIYVPRRWNQRISPSTSVIYVSPEGNGYHSRRGSVPDDNLVAFFDSVNIPIVGEIDNPVSIKPYNYSGYRFLWLAQAFALTITKKYPNGLYIPPRISEIFEKWVLPLDARDVARSKG